MLQFYLFAVCLALVAWSAAYCMAVRDMRRYVERRFSEYSRAILDGLREDFAE